MQEMETQLKHSNKEIEAVRKLEAILRAQSSDDYAKVLEANQRLRQKNEELKEEVEEMQAMNDILKAEVNRDRGM